MNCFLAIDVRADLVKGPTRIPEAGQTLVRIEAFRNWAAEADMGLCFAAHYPNPEVSQKIRFSPVLPVPIAHGLGGFNGYYGSQGSSERSLLDATPLINDPRSTSTLGNAILQYCVRPHRDRVFLCGLGLEDAVRATGLDLLKLGFLVVLLADACIAYNKKPDDGLDAVLDLEDAGARVFTTNDIIAGV